MRLRLRFWSREKSAHLVSNRVEDLARAKFPTEERGRPSQAQVDYRARLAGEVRVMVSMHRGGMSAIEKEAADVLEKHFLEPR